MLNEDGNINYFYLSNLVQTVLLMPHGNANSEQGFFVNKKVLENHGILHGDTTEPIKTAKDFLIQIVGKITLKSPQKY